MQKVPAFAELDATWALNEAQAWYDGLNLPNWIEKPLVYVWHESLGGHHNTLNLILQAISQKRSFDNYYDHELTKERLHQNKATHKAELKLKKEQPGDFLIVPSQTGKRWGGYSVKETCELYDKGEVGHGLVAAGCLILTHPNRLIRFAELDIICPGDEISNATKDSVFDIVPTFVFGGFKLNLTSIHSKDAVDVYGSMTGYFPQ